MDTAIFVMLTTLGVAVIFRMERRRHRLNQEG
jgi:hypothetical protein